MAHRIRTTRIWTAAWSGIVCGIFWLLPLPAHAQAMPAAARDLKLPQDVAPGEIAGVVVDAHGKPLADVLVDAWTWYPGDETRTNADGAFRLKPGSPDMQYVEIRFTKSGYSPQYFPQQRRGVKQFVVALDDGVDQLRFRDVRRFGCAVHVMG